MCIRVRLPICAALLLLGLAPLLPAAGPEPTTEEVRAAVARALPLLQKGAAGHRAQRTCFACHNQGIPLLALTTARARGFAVDGADLDKHFEFIATFLGKNRDNYLKGRGTGGQVDTAGYALYTLERGGWKPDDTTAAVAEYLLLYHKDQDHWRMSANRPPSEVSPFTTNYLGLRALQQYGTPEQRERVARRTEQVRAWLSRTPARDTEDRVFRLGALKLAGAPAEEVHTAARELLRTQRPDGGWAQTDGRDSDAYATGTALVMLHETGALVAHAPSYRLGVRFLLKDQREDGSWLVRSRSKPFQAYYESGFPHGKDQFISIAASGWAATALALTCPTTAEQSAAAER